MFNIAIKSQNMIYLSGLQALVEQALEQEGDIKYAFISHHEKIGQEQVNIIFTDMVVVINVFNDEKKATDHNTSNNHQATIQIPFNATCMELSEIVFKIKKIIRIAQMSYKKLKKGETYRKMGLKDFLQLSMTESKVIELICKGHDTTDISKMLNCSEKTIGTHRRNATRKLGIMNRVEFYKYASLVRNSYSQETIFLCL